MPTKTFANLPPEKKQAIFTAAIREFAANRFNAASINQVVKTAGISRGSFYQYFSGKEDLYLYVLAEIAREKIAVAEKVKQNQPGADFFQAFFYIFRSVLDWAKDKPLYHQVGMLVDYDDGVFIAKLTARAPAGWALLKEIFQRDQELGRIKPDADADMVINLLFTQNQHYFKQFYRTGSEENLRKQVLRLLEIIKGGIANV